MVNRLYSISIYNDYIGKPLYRFSKHYLSNSRLLALGIADIPGSLMTGGLLALIVQDIGTGLITAASHQIFYPLILYKTHLNNVNNRELRREFTKGIKKETIDDCI